MVDSRKSAQAKQQRRNRDGTYADEGKTSSMPSGSARKVAHFGSWPSMAR